MPGAEHPNNMEPKPQRSHEKSKDSAPATGPSLDALAETIIGTEATPEAIAARLASLALGDEQSRELVDHLLVRAERLISGEHPVRMLPLSERALLISDQTGYEKGRATSRLHVGVAHWFMSDLDRSLQKLLEAKRLFADLGDEAGQMKALNFEACVYRSMGDHDQSYLDLQRVLDFFQESGDTFWEGLALMSLGMTCEQLGDYKGVQRYNQRLIEILPEKEHSWIVGRALVGIGSVHYESGEYEKALEYHEKALATCREFHHPVGEARALNDMGRAYRRMGDVDRAAACYQESLQIRRDIRQREAQCTCLMNLGKLALDTGDTNSALGYLEEALATATEAGVKPRIGQAHKELSRAHEKAGDFEKALHHYKLFQEVGEQVLSEMTNTRLQNLRTRLELEQTARLAEVERQKNATLSEKNEQLRNLLRELQTAQAHLVQAEKMAGLGRLVAGVAHEMNTPLGASGSSIDISRRCIARITDLLESSPTNDDPARRNQLQQLVTLLLSNYEVVSKANSRLQRIVGSLRSFSILDEARFQKADVHEGLDSTITLLEGELEGRITVVKEYGDLEPIGCYPGELNQVFLNILTNSIEAIRRTGREGEITVRTSLENDRICIRIADNGTGIPENKIDTIFDLEFSEERARVKAGMGLFISQNIVSKHKGRIAVESEVDRGTTVSLFLPVDPDGRGES
jgi:signal transduction histidine kinase